MFQFYFSWVDSLRTTYVSASSTVTCRSFSRSTLFPAIHRVMSLPSILRSSFTHTFTWNISQRHITNYTSQQGSFYLHAGWSQYCTGSNHTHLFIVFGRCWIYTSDPSSVITAHSSDVLTTHQALWWVPHQSVTCSPFRPRVGSHVQAALGAGSLTNSTGTTDSCVITYLWYIQTTYVVIHKSYWWYYRTLCLNWYHTALLINTITVQNFNFLSSNYNIHNLLVNDSHCTTFTL